MVVGYARVSTKDQSLDSQKNLLKKAGCEKRYSDVAIGTKEDRKGLKRILEHPRDGDTVITYKKDRMFRSLRNMINLINVFNDKGIHFKSPGELEFDTREKSYWAGRREYPLRARINIIMQNFVL